MLLPAIQRVLFDPKQFELLNIKDSLLSRSLIVKAWKESISCLVALSSILLLVLLATSSTFLAASSIDESSKSFIANCLS